MAFESMDLEAIYSEIRRRQADVVRLSLVEFDADEYAALLDYAQRIVRHRWEWRWSLEKRQRARLVFLAFTMTFLRRKKYADDNVFWPDFEDVLGLGAMDRRFLVMDDLLWPAYQEEGLELRRDGRGRQIVGTLTNEMRQARVWVAQAPRQFVAFFKWYYRYHSGEKVAAPMLDTYRSQTHTSLLVLDQALPTLTRDCQALARVIDYAIENDLYLQASGLDEYRRRVVAALGPEHDPAGLRLIRDERTLVRLIMELQNHRTQAQFERELREQHWGSVAAPWGEQANIRIALNRWTPFPYGVYRVEGQEYHVVPDPRLRLKLLDDWPFEQVISLRGGRLLGYKKRSSFQVTIGRRDVEAVPFWRSPIEQFCVWVDHVPTGQKLAIDGRLRSESAGADWQVTLKLLPGRRERPGFGIVANRLVLYYPNRPHQAVKVWATTGHQHPDSLREDGVRRFHRHRALTVPLPAFDEAVTAGVDVGGDTVLSKAFTPEPCYLFSLSSRERVQARGLADVGDQEYVLFSRLPDRPSPSPAVGLTRLPEPFGPYTVFEVTWDDPSTPFELRLGEAYWAFQRRREFIHILAPPPETPYLRLGRHQFQSFADVSLAFYSSLDLTAIPLTLEVTLLSGDEGEPVELPLSPHLQGTESPNVCTVAASLWQALEKEWPQGYGQYHFRFVQNGTELGELRLAILPVPCLTDWSDGRLHLEGEPLTVVVKTPHPVWNPAAGEPAQQLELTFRPRTQAEQWPEHPGLRRIVSQPVSALASFPDLGETLEVVVHPRLFGFRLYLKRSGQTSTGKWRTHYQPVNQGDYYHLDETVLYVFSAPQSRVQLTIGARVVWVGETDANGDLLVDNLACLGPVCLGEETTITLRSGSLRNTFIVRWAPLLRELAVENGETVLRFNGPEDTFVRLWLRGPSGEAFWTQDVPCVGEEITTRVPLPADCPSLVYVVAGYVLSNGEVRPAAWQVQVAVREAGPIPTEWLLEGIGVADVKDLVMVGLNSV